MKRIALLLATVVAGSGCVVETTCDPQDLTIDWRFIDANGNQNLLCNQVPGVIDSVDIWVDGVRWDTSLPCTDYAVTYADVGTGSHRVVVEGFSGATPVNRDWADVYVDSCGNTSFAANPGEGWLEFATSGCSVNDGYLLYSLVDYTYDATGYLVDEINSASGIDIQTFTCSTGIYFITTMPYGDYELQGVAEVNSNATVSYKSHCAPVLATLDYFSPTSSPPDTTVIPVALGTVGGFCGL